MTTGANRRGLPPAATGLPVPADKRFRRSDVRPARRRTWRQWIGRAGWYGGAGILALMLAAWLGSALLDAAVLQVDHVVVNGTARLTPADIDARLVGLRGQSLLRVDLEQFHRQLVESPWVESAELWRVLPSTVQVRIVERTPLAVARLRGQLFLVDAGGVIIDSFGPQYRDLDLPVVDGLLQSGPTGTVASPEGIRLVQRLFAELAGRQEMFRRVSQVDVSDPRNAVVLLEGEPAELRLGDGHFLEALQRYEQVRQGLAEPPREYYELRFLGDRVWVK